jgi:hypothetical protein
VTISTNGYVCFGYNSNCGSITRPTLTNMLVGLNFDLNPARSGSGQIYYQKLSPNSTFFQAASDTIKLINSTIEPTNIFMITYDAVIPYSSSYDATYKASFQIFLLTDSSASYVIFKFTSCLNGLSVLAPSGLYYYFEQSWILDEITNQCSSSNVNRAGIWVFKASGIHFKLFIIMKNSRFLNTSRIFPKAPRKLCKKIHNLTNVT